MLDSRGMDAKQAMKSTVYNMIQVGLTLEVAFALAEVPPATQDEFRADPAFMARIDFYTASKERDLLRRLNNIAEANEARGISTEVRWLLSRLYPARYGARTFVQGTLGNDLPAPMAVSTDDDEE